MLMEEILLDKERKKGVDSGQPQWAVDIILLNDGASSEALDFLAESDSVCADKIVVALDHDTPSGSVAVSARQRKLINFAKKHGTVFFNGEGAAYQLMLDKLLQPGQLAVSCGDHTATLGAAGAVVFSISPKQLAEVMKTGLLSLPMPPVAPVEVSGALRLGVTGKDAALHFVSKAGLEKFAGKIIAFYGTALDRLSFPDKMALCNLAQRTGAVSALIVAGGGGQECLYRLEMDKVEPLIAGPDGFTEVMPVGNVRGVKVNEVFIGGCGGGRIEDLRTADRIIRGKQVAEGLRLLIAPATADTYVEALREGLIDDFIDCGAVIMNQGCSVCWGKSQGILDDGEVLLSAGSYNDKGRAGSENAKIYLSSVITAAESALAGHITNAAGKGA